MTLLLPLAGGPRTIPSARRRTKPQTSCTQGFHSASLSYRPPLADAAFCNPIAPAPSYRPAYPLTALSSPTTKIRAAPPSGLSPILCNSFAYTLAVVYSLKHKIGKRASCVSVKRVCQYPEWCASSATDGGGPHNPHPSAQRLPLLGR